MKNAWTFGEPPEGVKMAWLRVESCLDSGDHVEVVLAFKDSDGEWCEAADWRCEEGLDIIGGSSWHWMPYEVPTSAL